MGLCASIVLVLLEVAVPQVALFGKIEGHIQKLNFSEALLDGMPVVLFRPSRFGAVVRRFAHPSAKSEKG